MCRSSRLCHWTLTGKHEHTHTPTSVLREISNMLTSPSGSLVGCQASALCFVATTKHDEFATAGIICIVIAAWGCLVQWYAESFVIPHTSKVPKTMTKCHYIYEQWVYCSISRQIENMNSQLRLHQGDMSSRKKQFVFFPLGNIYLILMVPVHIWPGTVDENQPSITLGSFKMFQSNRTL